MEMYNPSHPGRILLEECLNPLGINLLSFARRIGISINVLSDIVNGKTGINAEIALKISKALGTSAQLWLNMQQQYDLWQAKHKVNLDDIEPINKTNYSEDMRSM